MTSVAYAETTDRIRRTIAGTQPREPRQRHEHPVLRAVATGTFWWLVAMGALGWVAQQDFVAQFLAW
ncbi:MAG: hypothetical protein DCC71_17630 [Proteobacteria bacterium]|nr:MAG: hypothetical protein DCC71_17630 [Pseudomonadota bacterium]